jgi:hypothetical protein
MTKASKIELSVGEKINVPQQLYFKRKPICTLYIDSGIAADLCKILQIKHPNDLSLMIITMIKSNRLHVQINEEEKFLVMKYDSYILGGKIFINKGGLYCCTLTKASFY